MSLTTSNALSLVVSQLGPKEPGIADDLYRNLVDGVAQLLSLLERERPPLRRQQLSVDSFAAIAELMLARRVSSPARRCQQLPDAVLRAWLEHRSSIVASHRRLLLGLCESDAHVAGNGANDRDAAGGDAGGIEARLDFRQMARCVVESVRGPEASFFVSLVGTAVARALAVEVLFPERDLRVVSCGSVDPSPSILRGALMTMWMSLPHATGGAAARSSAPFAHATTTACRDGGDDAGHDGQRPSSTSSRRVPAAAAAPAKYALWTRVRTDGVDVRAVLASSVALRLVLEVCSAMDEPVCGALRGALLRWAASLQPRSCAVRADLASCLLGLLLIVPAAASTTASAHDDEAAEGDVPFVDASRVQSCMRRQLRFRRKPGASSFSIELVRLDEVVFADVPFDDGDDGEDATSPPLAMSFAVAQRRRSSLLAPWVRVALSAPACVLTMCNGAFGDTMSRINADSEAVSLTSGLWLCRLLMELCRGAGADADAGARASSSAAECGVRLSVALVQSFQCLAAVAAAAAAGDLEHDRRQDAERDVHAALGEWSRWVACGEARHGTGDKDFRVALDNVLHCWCVLLFSGALMMLVANSNTQEDMESSPPVQCCLPFLGDGSWRPDVAAFQRLGSLSQQGAAVASRDHDTPASVWAGALSAAVDAVEAGELVLPQSATVLLDAYFV